MTRTEAREWFENTLNNNDFFPETEDAFKVAIEALSSADRPTVIRSKTLMPTKDFKEWAKRIREVNSNVVIIPCDAEVVSADAAQGFRGCKIPPKEMLNGTVLIPQHQWLEMERELAELKSKFESVDAEWIPCSERLPSEDECGWYLVTVKGHELFVDVTPFNDELWKGIANHQEVIAWMPLPKPYREEDKA